MEIVSVNYLTDDSRLIDHIVYELKAKGIFDNFRKECIADVDTKPAYQNLRQRVEGSVTGFLRTKKWKSDMNKNQVREMLRKNISDVISTYFRMKKGEILHIQAWELVYRVYQFIKREKEEREPVIPLDRVNERVAEATGISLATLKRIVKEGKGKADGETFSSSRKNVARPNLKSSVDQYDKEIILTITIYRSGFLETGVERIVDQVVNPKINSIFLPQVEDVVYKYLGVQKPSVQEELKEEVYRNCTVTTEKVDAALLPNDLEAVSPESEPPERPMDISSDSQKVGDSKIDEDESPPFEPLEQLGPLVNEENSIDSHISAFSGLASHKLNHSFNHISKVELSNQDTQLSKQSSDDYLSVVMSDVTDAKTESNDDSSHSKSFKAPDTSLKSIDCIQGDQATEMENKQDNSNESFKKHDDKSRSSSKQKHKSRHDSKEHKSNKDKKSDRDKRDHKDKHKHDSKIRKDKEKERKESKSDKDYKQDKSKSSSTSSTGSRHSSGTKDKVRKESNDNKAKNKKEPSDHKDSKSEKPKSKERGREDLKPRSESRSYSLYKSKSEGKTHSKHSEKSSSRSSKKDEQSAQKENKHSQSKRDDKHNKDKNNFKKESKDDHYGLKGKNSNRRSTDRDSSDGHSGTHSSSSSFADSSTQLIMQTSSQETLKVSSQSNSGDSRNSDATEQAVASTTILPQKESFYQQIPVKLIKPKFASNIYEARRLMRIRKKLGKIEKQFSLNSRTPVKNENKPVLNVPSEVSKLEESLVQNKIIMENLDILKETQDNATVLKHEETNDNKIYKDGESTVRIIDALSLKPTSVISKESWDALEAKHLETIDYNSYTESSIDFIEPVEVVSEETIKQSIDDCLYLTVDWARVNKYLNVVNMLIDQINDSITNKENLLRISNIHNIVSEGNEKSHKTTQKLPKLDLVDVTGDKEVEITPNKTLKYTTSIFNNNNNNNNKRKRQLIDGKVNKDLIANDATVKVSAKVKRMKCGDSAEKVGNHVDSFSLPLSPAESDKSFTADNTKVDKEDLRNKRNNLMARGGVNNLRSKRYSTDDLYKPRLQFSRTRRRNVDKNSN